MAVSDLNGNDSSVLDGDRPEGAGTDAQPPSRAQGHRLLAGIQQSVRDAAPAILAYACVRLVGVALLWLWAAQHGVSTLAKLGETADSDWYLGIAEHGYDEVIPVRADGTEANSNLAFFPLFPLLIRAVSAISPLSRPVAALTVSWLAGFAAAWGIYLIGKHLHDRRVGILLVVLWGTLPHAVVESMAYTETLVTAFAAFSLYAVLTRRWITAGVLCVFAGLVRPTALALVAAIAVGAALALWQRRDGWRPVLAAVIAPLGWLGYVAWVGIRLDRVDGYFHVQKVWGTSFDGGLFTLRKAHSLLTAPQASIVWYVVTAVLALSAVLLLVAHRQPWPVWVYSAAIFAITVGASGFYHSKARFMLPAFTLLLPVATGVARLRTRTLIVTLVAVTCASAWFGGYLRIVWPWSP